MHFGTRELYYCLPKFKERLIICVSNFFVQTASNSDFNNLQNIAHEQGHVCLHMSPPSSVALDCFTCMFLLEKLLTCMWVSLRRDNVSSMLILDGSLVAFNGALCVCF